MKYKGPSPAQKDTLFFMIRFFNEHQTQPSFREIAENFNLSSTHAVSDRLRGLEKKGYIEISRGARNRKITQKGWVIYEERA